MLEKVLLKINQWGAMLILAAPLLVNSNFIFPTVFPKHIFFRVIMLILLVAGAWYFLERDRRPKKNNFIFYAILFFLVVQIVAAVAGVNFRHSLWGNFERMDGLINLFFLVGYYFILQSVFIDKSDWLRLFRINLFFSLVLVIYALIQNGVEIAQNNWSNIGNSAFLGFYLLLNIFIVAIAWRLDKVKNWRIFYIVMGMIELVVMLLAASRAPILAGLAGLLVVGALYSLKANKKVKWIFTGGVLAVIIFGGVIVAARDTEVISKINFLNRLTHISYQDVTTNNRLLIWQNGWEAFLERPVLGYGMENFVFAVDKYYNPLISEQWFDRAHNFVVDYLVSSGIIGLISYLLMFLAVVYYGWQIRKKDQLLGSLIIGLVTAYLGTMFFVFDVINSWLLIMVILAFVGWLHSNYCLDEKIKIESQNKLPKIFSSLYYPILIVTVFVAVFLSFNIIIKPVRANMAAANAFRYSVADPQKTLAYFDEAFGYNTVGDRETALQLGRYSLTASKEEGLPLMTKKMIFEQAEKRLLEFLAKEPKNIQSRLVLAQVYLAYTPYNTFYIEETINVLKDYISTSPGRLETYFMIAEAYHLTKDLNQAINYLELAYQATNKVPMVYDNLINLYIQAGQKEKALAMLEEYQQNFSQLSAEQYRKIGQYYFQLGKIEEAKKMLLEKAIPTDTNYWKNYISVASIYESEKKYDEAINYLQEVLDAHPEWQDRLGEYQVYLKELKGKE
jgi:O-antigen ligase/tetratricopeptide (TPR) repeat protein